MPVRGRRGMGEGFDCLTCNTGVPCSMLSQICGS